MEKIFQKVTQILVENGDIRREHEAVYQYALQSVLILGADILLSLFIGIILGKPGCCVLFLCTVIPLRSDAGGYHAPSLVLCYLLSCASLISTLLLVDKIDAHGGIVLMFSVLLSAVLIFIYAPLDAKNRPLSIREKKSIRKRARRTVCIELLAGFCLLPIDSRAAYTVWGAIILCAVGYVAWFIERRSGVSNEHGDKSI